MQWPFRQRLLALPTGEGREPRVFATVDGPRAVVRTVHFPLSKLENLSAWRRLAAELSASGVPVPRFSMVIAGDEGQDNEIAFIVAERIRGRPLPVALREDAAGARRQAEQLYVALAHFYASRVRAGGPYAVDLRNDQFLYGVSRHAEGPQPYWVDLDPVFGEFAPGDDPLNLARFHWRVEQVVTMVIEAEQLGHRKLMGARAAVDALLDTVASAHGADAKRRMSQLRAALREGTRVNGRFWIAKLLKERQHAHDDQAAGGSGR